MLLVLVCIAGIWLGFYCNVVIILPLALIGSPIFVLFNLSNHSFYATLGELIVLLILGQAGYMLGLTGRDAYRFVIARFHAALSDRI